MRRLDSFCKGFNTGPKALISLSEGALYNLMLDYVSIMEKDGYAGGYIESTLKAVTIDDVESYLEQEWEFGANLQNGKVIIKVSET